MSKYFSIAAAVIGVAALGLAPTYANAGVDVDLNLFVPGSYAQPVYVEPRPVYVPPPVYLQPRPVYVQPGSVYVTPEPFYAERQQRRAWREQQWRERQWRERQWRGSEDGHDRGQWRGQRDHDGDGVPNRYDRRPHNPYRY